MTETICNICKKVSNDCYRCIDKDCKMNEILKKIDVNDFSYDITIDIIDQSELQCLFCKDNLISGASYTEEGELRCLKCVSVLYFSCIDCNVLCKYLGCELPYFETDEIDEKEIYDKDIFHKKCKIEYYVGHKNEFYFIDDRGNYDCASDMISYIGDYGPDGGFLMYWECIKCDTIYYNTDK